MVAVEASNAPFLGRADVEKAFLVRARTAHALLRAIGAERLAGALLVSREDVLRFLRAAQRGLPYLAEDRRRRRVAHALQEAQLKLGARAVRFRVAPAPAQGHTIAGLPDTIRLAPGELRVACAGAENLLQQLFQLSKAIAQDFPTFERLISNNAAV